MQPVAEKIQKSCVRAISVFGVDSPVEVRYLVVGEDVLVDGDVTQPRGDHRAQDPERRRALRALVVVQRRDAT